jgi:hypothetical protein
VLTTEPIRATNRLYKGKVGRGGESVATNWLLLGLLLAVGYLTYRVHRLERALLQRGRVRRSTGDGKVVPLLKENIEPGPFKQGNERRKSPPPEREDPPSS